MQKLLKFHPLLPFYGIVSRKLLTLMILLLMLSVIDEAKGHETMYVLSGTVTDTSSSPLPGALVMVYPGDQLRVTNGTGMFQFDGLRSGSYIVKVSYTGFSIWIDTITLRGDYQLKVVLQPGVSTLNEVVVTANHHELLRREQSWSIESVDRAFIQRNPGTTLMHSLSRIPGVHSSDIGSGQSRPIIRGLGFNRVVVVEQGIRHEGQQWGADHGLELDRYAAGSVEVIRGPASILYGSDALGGVMVIQDGKIPLENTWGVVADVTAASNNQLAGGSLLLYARAKRVYATFRLTGIGYGDLRIPADSIAIYGYMAPLKNRRLRNTAGHDLNLHFSTGYEGKNIKTRLYVSQLAGQAGFLANAHGLEPRSVDTTLHDRSHRDVLMPRHAVLHRKVISRSNTRLGSWLVTMDLGYQQNLRKEFSEYTQHGYMPSTLPETLPIADSLERHFDREFMSGVVRASRSITPRGLLTAGVQADHDKNSIHGRSFIIPAYTGSGFATFAYGRYHLSPGHIVHTGIRIDVKRFQTEPYTDWYPSPVVMLGDTAMVNLVRASALERRYLNTTWSVGYNRNLEKITFKFNIAQGFRNPMPQELAANGLNYHQFSFEVGDSTLNPEISYQADAGIYYASGNLAFEITPFASYSPNYIYLNPTAAFDRLYGAGNQIYSYTQSAVLRSGGEFHLHYDVSPWLRAGTIVEYSRSVQLSGPKRGFSLPFSPPLSAIVNLQVNGKNFQRISSPWISLDWMLVAGQQRIVPPEEPTPGYMLLNLTAGARVHLWKSHAELILGIHNILNNKYMEHISYYRMINIPGPGRNVTLQLSIPVSGTINAKR